MRTEAVLPKKARCISAGNWSFRDIPTGVRATYFHVSACERVRCASTCFSGFWAARFTGPLDSSSFPARTDEREVLVISSGETVAARLAGSFDRAAWRGGV